jgi:beta-lactamase class A
MKSKTIKQAIGIMKQNKLSDGTVYPDRQFKYDNILKSGIVNVIQIAPKHYMVVFEIHLV